MLVIIFLIICPSILTTHKYVKNKNIKDNCYNSNVIFKNSVVFFTIITLAVYALYMCCYAQEIYDKKINMSVGMFIIIMPIYYLLIYLLPVRIGNKQNIIKVTIKAMTVYIISFSLYFSYNNRNIYVDNTQMFLYALSVFAMIGLLWIFPEKLKKLLKRFKNIDYCFILLSPLFGLYLVEMTCNPLLKQMTLYYWTINVALFAVFLYILFCLIRNMRVVLYVFYTLAFLLGLVEYYVIQFRTTPILPSDLLSINTALQVADGYQFLLNDTILGAIILYFFFLLMIQIISFTTNKKRTIMHRCIQIIVPIICVCTGFNKYNFSDKFSMTIDYWWPSNTYYSNGFALSFLTILQDMKVAKPADYSDKMVDQIYLSSDLVNQGESNDDVPDQKPTVIAIMSESFSDFDVYGTMDNTEDPLNEWKSIDHCVARGDLYVSAFGGGTCNTEFEFLTFNSIGNLPMGAIPYQLYGMGNISNLAQVFKDQGYNTLAIHPASANNWSREKVYKEFQFDRFLSLDDFNDPYYIRNFVSDKSCYEKIISEYEAMDGPSFIFNVTIQNHGGYDVNTITNLEKVEMSGELGEFDDLETYLSLIKQSDKALVELFDYFSNVEEPVVICIFGDHQPSLNQNVYPLLYGKELSELTLEEQQKQYTVPYLIWSNEYVGETQNINMSTNYLGAYLLETADVEGNEYTDYLIKQMEKVPAINRLGYMDSEHKWHGFEEETSLSELINQYKILQYNSMFIRNHNSSYYEVKKKEWGE